MWPPGSMPPGTLGGSIGFRVGCTNSRCTPRFLARRCTSVSAVVAVTPSPARSLPSHPSPLWAGWAVAVAVVAVVAVNLLKDRS